METLFDEPGAFDRDQLAARLRELAAQNIYIGGSSWKYEGWLGQVYSRARYLARGKFSKRVFETKCLQRVRRDLSHRVRRFRVLPVPHRRLLAQALRAGAARASASPSRCRSRSPARCSRTHARYGPQAGQENDRFLDAEMLKEMFLRPLEPYREKTALLIFEFGTFSKRAVAGAGRVSGAPGPVPGALPPEFRYAVEVRNPEFLERDYFRCLREHGVAHVYNAWSPHAGAEPAAGHPGFDDGGFRGQPRAAAARAGV